MARLVLTMSDSRIRPKRFVLERAVINAADAVSAAKPWDRGPLRPNARFAVKALRQHVEEHGCEGVNCRTVSRRTLPFAQDARLVAGRESLCSPEPDPLAH